MKHGQVIVNLSAAFFILVSGSYTAKAQQPTVLSKEDQFRVSEMLHFAYTDVKKYYYDQSLHGLDWEGKYKQYEAMVGKAHNLGEGLKVVASLLRELDDSHTFFTPPERSTRYDSGYRSQMVGDACLVTQVRPGTDAATKLHVGDQIELLDGFNVNRGDFDDLGYFFNTLAPQPAEQLNLRSPEGVRRQVVVNASVKANKRVMDLTDSADYYDILREDENDIHATRSRIVSKGELAIWKLQRFNLEGPEVDRAMAIVRKGKVLILDLRGNPGGYVDTLKWIVGGLFDRDIKIADREGRKESKPMIAKRQGGAYGGKLVVLIDAGSASGAELLARVVQIERRGTVIGDRSAGAVMESKHYSESEGTNTKIYYGFNVTDANLVMTDGKSLERAGVTPDELMNPSGADLAAGRDPVLAHAAELAGVKLDAEEAGRMFPFEWAPL